MMDDKSKTCLAKLNTVGQGGRSLEKGASTHYDVVMTSEFQFTSNF